jgi:hypothetical protein
VELDAYDEPMLIEPRLMKDGQLTKAKIIGRKRDTNNNLIGCYDSNPILNTRVYLSQFPDGHIQELSANVLIEAIYDQIDDDGYDETLFRDVIDHKRTHTHSSDATRATTKGWELCVSWQDGSTSWHTLQEIKNCFPLQLAEYAVRNHLEKEPAFSCWVPYSLKKRK